MKLLLILLGLGISFIQLVWTLTDPRPQKNYFAYFKRQGFANTYLAQMALIVPQIISGIFFPWSLGKLDFFVSALGLCIFYCGIIVAVWAKLVMRKSWGVPGEHDFTRQDKLITQGPFSFSRNPIYLGLLLLSFGLSLALRSYFIFLTFFLFTHFDQAIKKEEKHLQNYFGDAYTAYLKKVPRYI